MILLFNREQILAGAVLGEGIHILLPTFDELKNRAYFMT